MTELSIIIEDWTLQPWVATKYIHDENCLDICAILANLKRLVSFPRCQHAKAHRDDRGIAFWPCRQCDDTFIELFWSSATSLLDYFADFLVIDSVAMQSIWFDMLDMWQEASMWYPRKVDMKEENLIGDVAVWQEHKEAAQMFEDDYVQTLDVIRINIFGRRRAEVPSEPIIFKLHAQMDTLNHIYEGGPWISGLKPWQQFLQAGSPGAFSLNLAGSEDEAKDDSKNMVAGGENNTDDAIKDSQAARSIRSVPMPAIGIIYKHTARARRLISRLIPLALTPTHPLNIEKLNSFLQDFDNRRLRFPSQEPTNYHTYTSMSGRTLKYQLMNGAPPITRYQGFGDIDEDWDTPTFTWLDDLIGSCKGQVAYVPQSRVEQNEDADEDEVDEYEQENAFDMWVVKDIGSSEKSRLEGFDEMFEEWIGEEEFRVVPTSIE